MGKKIDQNIQKLFEAAQYNRTICITNFIFKKMVHASVVIIIMPAVRVTPLTNNLKL